MIADPSYGEPSSVAPRGGQMNCLLFSLWYLASWNMRNIYKLVYVEGFIVTQRHACDVHALVYAGVVDKTKMMRL